MATRKAAAKKGAAKKAAKKSAKKGAAKKGAAKAASRGIFNLAAFNKLQHAVINRKEWVMYGLPPHEVLATGNIALMRRVLELGRRHLAEVNTKVARLEAAARGGR